MLAVAAYLPFGNRQRTAHRPSCLVLSQKKISIIRMQAGINERNAIGGPREPQPVSIHSHVLPALKGSVPRSRSLMRQKVQPRRAADPSGDPNNVLPGNVTTDNAVKKRGGSPSVHRALSIFNTALTVFRAKARSCHEPKLWSLQLGSLAICAVLLLPTTSYAILQNLFLTPNHAFFSLSQYLPRK